LARKVYKKPTQMHYRDIVISWYFSTC